MFFQTSPVARLPSNLVVGGFQSPDQYYNYYTRQVMLFLAICVVYALTLSIILLTIIIVHERIIYKYFIAQPMHIVTRQCLNIRARPPSRWSGPTYRRKTSAAVRRVKSGVKRGFICGINGIYRDESYSSSDFADRNNGSNGNFGI